MIQRLHVPKRHSSPRCMIQFITTILCLIPRGGRSYMVTQVSLSMSVALYCFLFQQLNGFCQQVAVAQHLGLQILRMSDALILPLNTTHYSYELENYLDRYASLLPYYMTRLTWHLTGSNQLWRHHSWTWICPHSVNRSNCCRPKALHWMLRSRRQSTSSKS
jgi:hypothetical protein